MPNDLPRKGAIEVCCDQVIAETCFKAGSLTPLLFQAADGSYLSGFDTEGGSDAFKACVPAGVGGAPSDVAAMVAFVASDLGRYINGQTLRVDGGMSACNVFW